MKRHPVSIHINALEEMDVEVTLLIIIDQVISLSSDDKALCVEI